MKIRNYHRHLFILFHLRWNSIMEGGIPLKREKLKIVSQTKAPAISLLLTILIISSMLMAAVLLSDMIMRQAQVTKGSESAELAYFAAESAAEQISYDIFKNYRNPGSYTYATSNLLNGAQIAMDSLSIDYNEPNTSNQINGTNPWDVTLAASTSLIYSLDLNGATYPDTFTVTSTQATGSEVIIMKWLRTSTSSCTKGQDLDVELPVTSETLDTTNCYYKLRINNKSGSSLNYSITPNDTNDNEKRLPVGIIIQASGQSGNYHRKVYLTFPKWQTL